MMKFGVRSNVGPAGRDFTDLLMYKISKKLQKVTKISLQNAEEYWMLRKYITESWS